MSSFGVSRVCGLVLDTLPDYIEIKIFLCMYDVVFQKSEHFEKKKTFS